VAVAFDSLPASPVLNRSATSPLTYSFTVNASQAYLLVGVEVTSTGAVVAVTSVTYGGQTCKRVGQQFWSTSFDVVEFWELQNPPTGANNVVVTATTNTDIFSAAVSLTGVDSTEAVRQTLGSAPASGTSISVTLPAVQDGSFVFSMAGTGGGAGPGFTGWNGNLLGLLNQSNTTAGDNAAFQYCIGSGGQSATLAHVMDSDFAGMVAVEIQAPISLQAENAPADVLLGVYGPIRYFPGTAFQPNAFQDSAFQVFGGVVGGGTGYNESLSETALAQESLKTVQGIAQPFSESALAQENLKTVQGMLAVLQEQALAQDNLAAAKAVPVTLAESALAQDALLSAEGFAQGLSEQALAQDTSKAGQGAAQGTSESALAQEATATAQGFAQGASESAAAQDVLSSTQTMLVSLSENAFAQETLLGAAGFPVGLSEQSLADVLIDNTYLPGQAGGAHAYNEGVAEQLLAQDIFKTAQFVLSGFAEAAAAQDILQTAQGMPSRQSDSALAQDALGSATAFAVSQADSALAQDSVLGAQGFAQTQDDVALAQDVVLSAQGMAQPFMESSLAQELINSADGMHLELSEVSLADVLYDSTLFKGGVKPQTGAVFVFED
jgi:hypothetical protein